MSRCICGLQVHYGQCPATLDARDAEIARLTDLLRRCEKADLAGSEAQWEQQAADLLAANARLTFERDEAVASALRFSEQRDALLAACEFIANFGCINRARVMRDTTCGECDPCTARAAIEKARGGDHA